MAKTPETKEEFEELLWRIGKCMEKPGTAKLNEKTGMLEDHDEELEELFTHLEEVVNTRPEIAVHVWVDKETGAISYPSSKDSLFYRKSVEGKVDDLTKRGYVPLCEAKEKPQNLHLVPLENNLIDLGMWFMSTKGIKAKDEDLKLDKLVYRKGDITLEFHRKISPPTMFAFRVAAICHQLWFLDNRPDSLFTSRKQIARMMNIVPSGHNIEHIDIALRQLHNMYVTGPFWIPDEKDETKKVRLLKFNILTVFGEVEKDGQRAMQLALNPMVWRSKRKQRYTILDLDFMRALNSPVAQRLYSKIKRQKGSVWFCSLGKIVDLCNLRGRRKKEMVVKAAQELRENGFLKSYKVKYSERQHDLIFTFVKKQGG